MATATNANDRDVWDMTVGGNNGGGDYVACPPGNHPGTIVGLFDVGTQDEQSPQGPRKIHRLIMVFELVKKRPDGAPFVVMRRYTKSLNEKSNLYKELCNLLGARLKDGEKFNPSKLVGFPVLVSVANTQSGDRTFHDVTSIAQYPEGFPPIAPSYPKVVWSILTGAPFPEGLDWLPFVYGKSIKDLAMSSSEAMLRLGEDRPDFGPGSPDPLRTAAIAEAFGKYADRQKNVPAGNDPLNPPAARGADDTPF